MRFQTKTGSEWHTTNWRQAKVLIGGKPIYEVLKALSQEWELVGSKGRHGKWCVAIYDIPMGSEVEFIAKRNGQKPYSYKFVVGEQESPIEQDGFKYGGRICGWILELEEESE